MRIVSKFQDYYDSAQGMGIDETLVYVRKPAKIKLDKSDEDVLTSIMKLAPVYKNRFDDPCSSHTMIIGFCGEIFPCMEINIPIGKRRKYDTHGPEENIIETTYIYSYDELIECLTRHKLKKQLYEVTVKDAMWGANRITTQEFFNLSEESRFENIFIENKAPIFVAVKDKEIVVGTETNCIGVKKPIYENRGVIINPSLKDLGFARMVDSFTAFQEVSMYLGGVIPKDGPEMVEISDKMMLQKKGFHDPTSFRSMPDTRKRKSKTGKIKKKR